MKPGLMSRLSRTTSYRQSLLLIYFFMLILLGGEMSLWCFCFVSMMVVSANLGKVLVFQHFRGGSGASIV